MVIQLMLPGATQLPEDDDLAPRRSRAPVAPMVPTYPAVLRTPIFSPDRAPGEAPASVGAQGSATAASLQVLGVASFGRGSSALVRSPDGATHVISSGQTLQGWRLVSVLPNAAVFLSPVGRTVLQVGAPEAKSTTATSATPSPTSPSSSEPPP